jgi:PTS system mannose-specific IIB component
MELALLRIDDRLVHGQVVIGWIPHLKAQAVVVASDAAAADATQTMLMEMAMPEGVALAPGPLEALRLLELGVKSPAVNVGGLHYTAGRVQLGKAIFLDDQDREALRAIARRGVALEGRALPGDSAMDVSAMLGERI